jgi:hypothetical protein
MVLAVFDHLGIHRFRKVLVLGKDQCLELVQFRDILQEKVVVMGTVQVLTVLVRGKALHLEFGQFQGILQGKVVVKDIVQVLPVLLQMVLARFRGILRTVVMKDIVQVQTVLVQGKEHQMVFAQFQEILQGKVVAKGTVQVLMALVQLYQASRDNHQVRMDLVEFHIIHRERKVLRDIQ